MIKTARAIFHQPRAAGKNMTARRELAPIRIQPKERKDMKLPYPYFISSDGSVGRQDFWKGEPLKLVGFAPHPSKQVTCLELKEFLKRPKLCIGLYPVFEFSDGQWYTFKDPIESVGKI